MMMMHRCWRRTIDKRNILTVMHCIYLQSGILFLSTEDRCFQLMDGDACRVAHHTFITLNRGSVLSPANVMPVDWQECFLHSCIAFLNVSCMQECILHARKYLACKNVSCMQECILHDPLLTVVNYYQQMICVVSS